MKRSSSMGFFPNMTLGIKVREDPGRWASLQAAGRRVEKADEQAPQGGRTPGTATCSRNLSRWRRQCAEEASQQSKGEEQAFLNDLLQLERLNFVPNMSPLETVGGCFVCALLPSGIAGQPVQSPQYTGPIWCKKQWLMSASASARRKSQAFGV